MVKVGNKTLSAQSVNGLTESEFCAKYRAARIVYEERVERLQSIDREIGETKAKGKTKGKERGKGN